MNETLTNQNLVSEILAGLDTPDKIRREYEKLIGQRLDDSAIIRRDDFNWHFKNILPRISTETKAAAEAFTEPSESDLLKAGGAMATVGASTLMFHPGIVLILAAMSIWAYKKHAERKEQEKLKKQAVPAFMLYKVAESRLCEMIDRAMLYGAQPESESNKSAATDVACCRPKWPLFKFIPLGEKDNHGAIIKSLAANQLLFGGPGKYKDKSEFKTVCHVGKPGNTTLTLFDLLVNEAIQRKIKITCFTTSCQSETLWNSFASGGTGMCLVFSPEEYPDAFRFVLPVSYYETMPHLNAVTLWEAIAKTVTVKSGPMCSDQKEYRAICCDPVSTALNEDSKEGTVLVRYRPERLKAVIFGRQTDETHIKEVMNALKTHETVHYFQLLNAELEEGKPLAYRFRPLSTPGMPNGEPMDDKAFRAQIGAAVGA